MRDTAAAIEALYHRRYSGFRHGAAAVIGDREAAHDAVQDGFAAALVDRARFDGGSLEAWVRTIVVRKALDIRRRRGSDVPIEDDFNPELVESERDPEVAAAIRALSPRRRVMVFLRYFADLSYAEIADVCGVSAGTVAAALAQAHAELRRALELEGVER